MELVEYKIPHKLCHPGYDIICVIDSLKKFKKRKTF